MFIRTIKHGSGVPQEGDGGSVQEIELTPKEMGKWIRTVRWESE